MILTATSATVDSGVVSEQLRRYCVTVLVLRFVSVRRDSVNIKISFLVLSTSSKVTVTVEEYFCTC